MDYKHKNRKASVEFLYIFPDSDTRVFLSGHLLMEGFYLMANSLVVVKSTCAIKNSEVRKCLKIQPNLCRKYKVPNHRS